MERTPPLCNGSTLRGLYALKAYKFKTQPAISIKAEVTIKKT